MHFCREANGDADAAFSTYGHTVMQQRYSNFEKCEAAAFRLRCTKAKDIPEFLHIRSPKPGLAGTRDMLSIVGRRTVQKVHGVANKRSRGLWETIAHRPFSNSTVSANRRPNDYACFFPSITMLHL